MKKNLMRSLLFSFTMFLFSCQQDEPKVHHFKKTIVQPINKNNPCDSLGMLHNTLIDNYWLSSSNHSTPLEIGNIVNTLIADLNTLPQTTIPLDSSFSELIQFIIGYPEQNLDSITLNTSLSVIARQELNNFIELISLSNLNDYSTTCNLILSYEDEIAGTNSLDAEDKRIILTVTSIFKYSLAYDEGRKDKDWEVSVGCIVAASYGAIHSAQDALLIEITSEILLNNKP